jgi:propane monooxygenase coupling protein
MNPVASATPAARDMVGISLMASAETEAAVEYLRERVPDATISFRDCYYKIERPGVLAFDMDEIADHLGRALDTSIFLVNMSSYYGRIVVSDRKVEIFSEIVPERFRD